MFGQIDALIAEADANILCDLLLMLQLREKEVAKRLAHPICFRCHQKLTDADYRYGQEGFCVTCTQTVQEMQKRAAQAQQQAGV